MSSDGQSLYFSRSTVTYVVQLKRKRYKYASWVPVSVAYSMCGAAGCFPSLHYAKAQSSCATAWENEAFLEIKQPEEGR